jgi:hypothetical protein
MGNDCLKSSIIDYLRVCKHIKIKNLGNCATFIRRLTENKT